MSIGDYLAVGLASWFGIGFIPLFPNAWAVVAAYLLIVALGRHVGRLGLALALIGVTVTGTWASSAWGSLSEISDDGRIVIDEVAGYLLCILVARRVDFLGATGLAAAFVALDALKPWPFDRVETLPFGLGVMGDDLAAGLALGVAYVIATQMWRRISGGPDAHDGK